MATVTDVLETRLDLTNLPRYVEGMGKAGGAVTKWAAVTAGAAAVAVKSGQIIGGAFLEAAGDQAKFTTAAGNFKGGISVEEISAFSGALSRQTAVADDTIAGMMGLLGTYQLTADQAKELTLPLLNSQRALEAGGKSAEGLAEAVGKAFQLGSLTGLRKQGIAVDETAFKIDRLRAIIDALQKQGGDAAVEFGKTPEGKLLIFQLALKDLQGELGKEFIPAVTEGIRAATAFIHMITDAGPVVKTLAGIVGITAVGAFALFNSGAIGTMLMLRELRKANLATAASAVALADAQAAAGAAGLVPGVKQVAEKAAPSVAKKAAGIGTAVAGAAAAATAGKAIVDSSKLVKDADNIQRLTRPINSLTGEIAALGTKAAAVAPEAVSATKIGLTAGEAAAAGTAVGATAVQKMNLGQHIGAAFKSGGQTVAKALGLAKPTVEAATPVVNVANGAAAMGAATQTAGTAGKAVAATGQAAGFGAKLAGMGIKGVIGTVARVLGPVGWGMMAKDLIDLVPTNGNKQGEGVKNVLGKAAIGAGIGGTIGAAFGGIGAIPGAAIGGVIGAGVGYADEAGKMNKAAEAKAPTPGSAEDILAKILAATEKQTAEMQKMAREGKAIDFPGLSVVQQRSVMSAARAAA